MILKPKHVHAFREKDVFIIEFTIINNYYFLKIFLN